MWSNFNLKSKSTYDNQHWYKMMAEFESALVCKWRVFCMQATILSLQSSLRLCHIRCREPIVQKHLLRKSLWGFSVFHLTCSRFWKNLSFWERKYQFLIISRQNVIEKWQKIPQVHSITYNPCIHSMPYGYLYPLYTIVSK